MARDQGGNSHERKGRREDGHCKKQGVGSRSHNDTYEHARMLVSQRITNAASSRLPAPARRLSSAKTAIRRLDATD